MKAISIHKLAFIIFLFSLPVQAQIAPSGNTNSQTRPYKNEKLYWAGSCVGHYVYGLGQLKMRVEQFGTNAQSVYMKHSPNISKIENTVNQCKAGKTDIDTFNSCINKLSDDDYSLFWGFWAGFTRAKNKPNNLTLDTGSICEP